MRHIYKCNTLNNVTGDVKCKRGDIVALSAVVMGLHCCMGLDLLRVRVKEGKEVINSYQKLLMPDPVQI